MKDAFGNYIVQKLVEEDFSDAISSIVAQTKGQVLQLSLNTYSCRVLQKVIEMISNSQIVELVSELRGYVIQCVDDKNGCHVVQKCIEKAN